MNSHAMSDVPGLILVIAIATLGTASTVLAAVWTWKLLRRRDVGEVTAGVITAIAAIVAFGGLWLLFDLGWIVAAMMKAINRRGGGRQGPQRGKAPRP